MRLYQHTQACLQSRYALQHPLAILSPNPQFTLIDALEVISTHGLVPSIPKQTLVARLRSLLARIVKLALRFPVAQIRQSGERDSGGEGGLRLEFALLVVGPWVAVGFLPSDGLLDLFRVFWCGGHCAVNLVVDGLKYRDYWRMKSSPVESRLSTGLH